MRGVRLSLQRGVRVWYVADDKGLTVEGCMCDCSDSGESAATAEPVESFVLHSSQVI